MRKLIHTLVFVLMAWSLSSCTTGLKTNQVSVSGRQILVNESPYLIKGICYHPVPKGNDKRSFDNLTEDLDFNG